MNKSFIILDKQGPFSKVIKHSLKDTSLKVYRCKSTKRLTDFLYLKPNTKFDFLLFIFFEEYELVTCLELYNLDIPIIFAPTDKRSYKRLSKIEGIKLMDLSANKMEYKIQIIDFVKN
ncbi:hypothetical protein [Flavivirga spongiicola]|uniref:Response regulatory domain-containing protein n=1 Tax=Flavivirga spongiicola TaxID=421621 RepID=A0ABU7XYH4_9FLAO|nr:hypothetical protein [Flavivirga sp. MEBiC05379]MDO5980832.1 hypothetical protein [Flavivirga sp. MEBiC05379]